MPADPTPLDRLEHDGLIRRDQAGQALRTTKRWQAAMARAALRFLRTDEGGDDLRVPVVAALLELYGPETSNDQIADYLEAMLPIEAAELDPRTHIRRQEGAGPCR